MNVDLIFIDESTTGSCVGTSNYRLILTSVSISSILVLERQQVILWFSHPLFFTSSDFHILCTSCALFSTQSEAEITLFFKIIMSHFQYLLSPHQKDTNQIISCMDISDLFHCSVTNCSVVYLLSNQKCPNFPG